MKIINLGILAHVDAGKTTLTEAMLHISGAIRAAGRVDDGTTITDSMAVERERGITVRAATVSYEWAGVKVNILDTPGHMDFIAEVERALRVLDAAILVVSAKDGVQTQTRRLYAALTSVSIPTIIFVNKLDGLGANPEGALEKIRDLLTKKILPMQTYAPEVANIPIGDLSEAVIDADDTLTENYLNSDEITEDMLRCGLRRAVKARAILPVYFGAALKETGVRQIMDAISDICPGAQARNGDMCAEIYKVERLPRLGRLCYARLWSGDMLRGEQLMSGGEWLRVKQLMRLENGRMINVDKVDAGDIAVLGGLDQLRIGDILTGGDNAEGMRRVSLATPLLYSRVNCDPARRGDLINALRELADEDPLLDIEINDVTGEILVHIFGEVQMEIIVTLMRERFNLEITLDEPRTIFREKPERGGAGSIGWEETHFSGALSVAIEPIDGEEIEYESRVDYGYLTRPFQNAAREGILDALRQGAFGWQVFGVKAILTDAYYNSVMSTPADYRTIAPLAVHRALAQCGMRIYEPYVRYALRVPTGQAARAAYDISVMRGSIESTYAESDLMVYEGDVPMETSRSYPRQLMSYTKGLGSMDMRPADYRIYPGQAQTLAREGYDPTNIEKYLMQKAGVVKT